jgi:CheY-like chemotaxis protein
VSSSRANSIVLYVEDEESDTLFMQTAFRKAGLGTALRCVENGQEAINYLEGSGAFADRETHPLPALLLLDLNLPVVSGFGVLEWLRRHPEFHSLAVVVFSSSVRSEDRVRAMQLGANDYVEKPSSGLHFGRVVEGLREKWFGMAAAN